MVCLQNRIRVAGNQGWFLQVVRVRFHYDSSGLQCSTDLMNLPSSMKQLQLAAVKQTGSIHQQG